MSSSEIFYHEYVRGDDDLETLAFKKGLKVSTANLYVSQHYKSNDYKRILKKLGLKKHNVVNAYNVMTNTQVYRSEHPTVKAADLTPFIHEALGATCTCPTLATSVIRKLYFDLKS